MLRRCTSSGPSAMRRARPSVQISANGVSGPVPMAPVGADKINDADLESTVEWILKG